MTRKKKKGKHIKKSNKRISKSKLLIVALGVLLVGFFLFKGFKFTINGAVEIKENITVLAEAVFGPGYDKSNVNKEKQFDLEDENKDKKKKHVVYIDVGHGGSDVGYKSPGGATEKDLDMQISKLVSNRLSSQGDISVIVSRSTDVNLSHSERVEDGNKQNADIFVSIHMTANEDTAAEGVQTFYRVNSTDASDELATLVQKSIVSYVDLKDRGPKPFTFDVLKDNAMPAILIECGFLSNPTEEKKLTNPDFQKDLAEGISQGILSFLDVQG
ncbi:MAG: N-acetylmuramoyl-L-alanine amidase [Terrisporobacter sp.]|uniref:N-acetylmuramoyl-L-alanine amidase n=1 Tax=Terrisporobacter sp. TaxID=1965305 RepID=UPI002FCB4023